MIDKTTTIKFTPILGELPEMGATDWWTKEDWKAHYEYVEKLKAEGTYLAAGEELTITFKNHKIFEHTKEPFSDSSFRLLIPKEK